MSSTSFLKPFGTVAPPSGSAGSPAITVAFPPQQQHQEQEEAAIFLLPPPPTSAVCGGLDGFDNEWIGDTCSTQSPLFFVGDQPHCATADDSDTADALLDEIESCRQHALVTPDGAFHAAEVSHFWSEPASELYQDPWVHPRRSVDSFSLFRNAPQRSRSTSGGRTPAQVRLAALHSLDGFSLDEAL